MSSIAGTRTTLSLGNGLRLVAQQIKHEEELETWKAIDELPTTDRMAVLFGVGIGQPVDRLSKTSKHWHQRSAPWSAKRKRRKARERRGR